MGVTKIMVADDDPVIRDVIGSTLEMFGHEVMAVADGREALASLNEDFDAVVLDINMPGMDGFEALACINELNLDIPVIFLTGNGSMDYAVKALNMGAYDFITKPVEDFDLFNAKIKRAVEKRMYVRLEKEYKENLEAEVAAKTLELAEKNKLLKRYSKYLESATLNIILTLQTAMEEKDEYTAGHTARVTEYALLIGQAMNLPEDDLVVLKRAAQLHDIGKLVIDTSSIKKPGPLTEEEWGHVKRHPEVGRNIISPLTFLHREGQIIRHHHERVDGNGYPGQLAGNNLDLLTKIITVADSYDAMTSRRGYKRNKTTGEALEELRRCANAQFDPEIVSIFAGLLDKTPEARAAV